MTPETLIMAVWLSVAIYTFRNGAGQIRKVWSAATWYERALMCLVFVPVPGPVDELIALTVISRVARRMSK